ncbi:porin [Thioalkalivibrio sp. ALJ16]|uniref:porin n=1 Tax=Thioalkalivibrio sp. ALJ16 TaxID=1158762 RepID=UPI00037F82AE|nr:porin [Thioalkalivibrio sp. ALJ16]
MKKTTSWTLAPLSGAVALALFLGPNAAVAEGAGGLNFDFYGSLRTHGEYVRPDNRNESDGGVDSYWGMRDAYSRLGVHMNYDINDQLELFGQLEIALDSANLKVQDPYDQEEEVRVAQVGLRGDFGTIQIGQQWLPYYNAISFPVDMFSTYYSGFATYTVFRVRDSVAYYSPDFNGFSFAASYSDDRGNESSTSRIDDSRAQFTASYNFGDTTISAGVDDRGNANGERDRIYGLSASHQMGDWYFAAKYEQFDTFNDTSGAFNEDGGEAFNVFASYTLGKNTFKAMLANVDNYGEDIVHLGYDYQYNDSLKFFAEYYYEEETAAITPRRGGLQDFPANAQGGQVIAAGLRFDF